MAGTPIGGLAGGGTLGAWGSSGAIVGGFTTPSSGASKTPGPGASKQQPGTTAGGANDWLETLGTMFGGGSTQGTTTAANFNPLAALGATITSIVGMGNPSGRPAGTMPNNPAGSYFGGGNMTGWGPPQQPAYQPPQQPAYQPPPQPAYQPPPQPPAYYPPPEPPKSSGVPEAPAWYKKWWVWASVAGGLAVLGTGSYLLLRNPGRAAAGLGNSRISRLRGW